MFQQGQQALQQLCRRGWTAGDVEVDRHDVLHAARDRVAAGEHAAVDGAIPDRDHPFWVGCRVIGPP